MAEFDPVFVTNPSVVLPALAAGATITNGVGAWALGAATAQVAAAGTVPAVPFTIDTVHLDTPSGAFVGELRLYYGGADTLCGAIALEVATDAGVIAPVPIKTGLIPAGSRIHASLATAAGGGATTIGVKVSCRIV